MLLAAAAVTASVALAAPAYADVTGSTATEDVVLYDHCQQHPISYDLQIGPLTAPWRVEFQVFDPSGHTSEGTVLNSATNPPTSGTFTRTFCGSEPTGTYTVRATVRYAPVNLEVPLAPTSFEVRPAGTRTSLVQRSLGHGRHRLTAKVREQDEHGYARANGIPVRLEKRTHGQWHRVRGISLTTVHGRAVAIVDSPGTYRAVAVAGGNHAESTSRPVTLPRTTTG